MRTDYAGKVQFVSDSLPSLCLYQQMVFNTSATNITGMASDPTAVLSFAGALENSPQISSAHISSITPIQDSTDVNFAIEIK